MVKARFEQSHEDLKSQVRAEIYKLTRKASWDYPAGVDEAIGVHLQAGKGARSTALLIVARFWPSATDSRTEERGVPGEPHWKTLEKLRDALSTYESEVSADDARFILSHWGIEPGNWLGALFKHPDWEMVGQILSKADSRHGNLIGLWRFKGRKVKGQRGK
jgi:hypothetical protein